MKLRHSIFVCLLLVLTIPFRIIDILELEHCAAAYYSFHLAHIALDRFGLSLGGTPVVRRMFWK